MEAGTAPAAPAAADGNGQVQAPTPAQPAAPTQPTEQNLSPEDQHASELQEMKQRAEAAEAQLQQFQPDLLSALQDGGEEDFALTPEDLAEYQQTGQLQQQGQVDPATQQDQLAELDALLQERVQQAMDPYLEQQWGREMQEWENAHPDAKPGTELFDAIVTSAKDLVSRYGGQGRVDPQTLDLVYAAAKAKAADAGAVPAEQAGADGASLETGAGQTQVGEDSEADRYRKALLGAADNPLA